MGNSDSTSKLDSEFHEVCRKGDVERARELLPMMNYKSINGRGKDGNAPLHSACANNHRDIVLLLLKERDICSRILRNRDGKTAYECANSPEIQQLFHRPRNSAMDRYCETNPRSLLQPILSAHAQEKNTYEPIPDDWMRGYKDVKSTFDGQFMLALQNAPLLLRGLLKLRTENEACDEFELLLNRCLERAPLHRERLFEEYRNYRQTKNIELLFNIYTADTPLYSTLQHDMNSYMTIVFLNLKSLTKRAFTGVTYRGAQMSQLDIEAYQWAQKSENYLLETRVFQSTSKSTDIARMFGEAQPRTGKFGVIMTFTFKERCMTAIDLHDVSDFGGEEEVLVLPFTLFKVDQVECDPLSKTCEISLTNIPPTKRSFLISWWNLIN